MTNETFCPEDTMDVVKDCTDTVRFFVGVCMYGGVFVNNEYIKCVSKLDFF